MFFPVFALSFSTIDALREADVISRIFRLCLALATGVILAFAGTGDAIAKCGGETRIRNLVAFLNCDPTGISYKNISRAMDKDVDKICRAACSNVKNLNDQKNCQREYLKVIDRHKRAVKKYARGRGCKFRVKYFEEELKAAGGKRTGSTMLKGCKTVGNWKRTVYGPPAKGCPSCDFHIKDAILCEIELSCEAHSEFHKMHPEMNASDPIEGTLHCLANQETGDCLSVRGCITDKTVKDGKIYTENYLDRGKKVQSLEEQEDTSIPYR